jgi:phospholipase D1/2
MLTFAIGRLLGPDTVRSIAGSRIDRLSRQVARHGLLGVLTVRVLPVAPFTIVNIVAGASHIRLRDFALGTLLGTLPGIFLLTLFGGRLKDVILDPKLENFVILTVLIALTVLGTIWASRRFATGDASKTATASTEREENG